MSVEIRLTPDQMQFFSEACTKAKLPIVARGTVIAITVETYEPVKKAVADAHTRSLLIKTKSVVHMERLYNLEGVIDRLEDIAPFFANAKKEEPLNDNQVVESKEVA